MTPKDKIVGMFGNEWNCNCPGSYALGPTLRSPEAAVNSVYNPNWQTQVTWNRPVTNRLLLEAGNVIVNGRAQRRAVRGLRRGSVRARLVEELSLRQLSYGLGLNGAQGYNTFRQANQKVALSYVTGSHSFKTGIQLMHGWRDAYFFMDPARKLLKATSSTAGPRPPSTTMPGRSATKAGMRTLGLFAQDQWTIERLTLNLGLRFDHLNGRVPALELPAGPWVPARSFPEVKNVPNWKDVNPRVGAAYDLFGTGQTAIKGFLGRYVDLRADGRHHLAEQPGEPDGHHCVAGVDRRQSATMCPQENELGRSPNANFGQHRARRRRIPTTC